MAFKVKALETVFDGGRRYRAGEVFILSPGHKPGKGFEVLGEVEAPKVKEAAKKEPTAEPTTLSEISKTITLKRAKESA